MFNQNEQEVTEPLKVKDEDDFWIQLMCQIYNHIIEDGSETKDV